MIRTLVKWLILLALIASAVVLTVWAGQQADAALCKGVEVEVVGGDPRSVSTTQRGVYNEVLRFDSHLLRKRASSINTLALQTHLSRISNFESVHRMMTSKGKLRITVVPMIPELRVFDGDDSYYVNKDGNRIKADARFYADVPVARGHFTDRFPATSILPVVRFVRSDSALRNIVAMFEAHSPSDIMLIPRIAGHVVNFGDTLDLDRKRRALMAFYRKVMPYKGWETYDTVSVKFRGQIVASRRDKGLPQHSGVAEEEVDLEEAALAAHAAPEAESQPRTDAETN